MHPLRCVFQVLGWTLFATISIANWYRKTKPTTLGKAWNRLVEDWSTADSQGSVTRMRAAGTKGDNGQVSVTKLVTYSRG